MQHLTSLVSKSSDSLSFGRLRDWLPCTARPRDVVDEPTGLLADAPLAPPIELALRTLEFVAPIVIVETKPGWPTLLTDSDTGWPSRCEAADPPAFGGVDMSGNSHACTSRVALSLSSSICQVVSLCIAGGPGTCAELGVGGGGRSVARQRAT